MRLLALATVVLIGSVASALASAGAPDPSFGTRGVVELPQQWTAKSNSWNGRAILLPNDSVVVPAYLTQYRRSIRDDEEPEVRRMSLRLKWLRSDGKLARVSRPIDLPRELGSPRLTRTADGHFLIVGTYYSDDSSVASLYVMRLSTNGVPQAAAGSSSASVLVPLENLPLMSGNTGPVDVGAISVAPSGRVFVVLRQSLMKRGGQLERTGYGPLFVTAIDPSIGLVSSFASGGLVIAPASDTRTEATAATTVDPAGRLLVFTRSIRQGIGGTAQTMYLARYEATGALDTSFAGGRLDIESDTIDTLFEGTPSIASLNGGDVLVRIDQTTESDGVNGTSIELRRYSSTGEPVAAFGNAGAARIRLQRTKTNGYGGRSYSSGFGYGEAPVVLEQPDGKLILSVTGFRTIFGRQVSRDGVLRATASGVLDATYERGGFARLDGPWYETATGSPIGIDSAGRLVANISSYTYYAGYGDRGGIIRLLGGDEPAPATSADLRVDNRKCGGEVARACFDPDGAVHLTGRVVAAGRGVVGAPVVLSISRPRSSSDEDAAPPVPAVRTGADGRFSVVLAKGRILPGTWEVTARVLATPSSQRVDLTRPVYFTLGPRADIAVLRDVHRAQGLAVAISYVLDDSAGYDDDDEEITSQCATLDICFGLSPELRSLVSATAHPAPGKAGVLLGKPGAYTVVTRARTTKFRLEFVITQTLDDYSYTCRGDAAARKRWCPGGVWSGNFDDPFVTARIDGGPFDY